MNYLEFFSMGNLSILFHLFTYSIFMSISMDSLLLQLSLLHSAQALKSLCFLTNNSPCCPLTSSFLFFPISLFLHPLLCLFFLISTLSYLNCLPHFSRCPPNSLPHVPNKVGKGGRQEWKMLISQYQNIIVAEKEAVFRALILSLLYLFIFKTLFIYF